MRHMVILQFLFHWRNYFRQLSEMTLSFRRVLSLVQGVPPAPQHEFQARICFSELTPPGAAESPINELRGQGSTKLAESDAESQSCRIVGHIAFLRMHISGVLRYRCPRPQTRTLGSARARREPLKSAWDDIVVVLLTTPCNTVHLTCFI